MNCSVCGVVELSQCDHNCSFCSTWVCSDCFYDMMMEDISECPENAECYDGTVYYHGTLFVCKDCRPSHICDVCDCCTSYVNSCNTCSVSRCDGCRPISAPDNDNSWKQIPYGCGICEKYTCKSCVHECHDCDLAMCKGCADNHNCNTDDENERVEWLMRYNPLTISSTASTTICVKNALVDFF